MFIEFYSQCKIVNSISVVPSLMIRNLFQFEMVSGLHHWETQQCFATKSLTPIFNTTRVHHFTAFKDNFANLEILSHWSLPTITHTNPSLTKYIHHPNPLITKLPPKCIHHLNPWTKSPKHITNKIHPSSKYSIKFLK